jgi:hypothetical protein
MITKILEIITNTGKAEKDIENLSSEVETLNTGLEKTNSEVGDLKKGGKAFDTLKKGAKGVAGGFRMMGTALKAAGIGLALAAFGLLKQLFEENQKVVDAFNIAFETLSIAFNDFFNYISDNVETVSGFFKKIFDDPLESLKTLGTAIKNNLIERVKSAIDAFGFLATAMKKLFARDFDGALKAVKQAGKELVDVTTGVDNSVDKITKTVEEGVKSLTEYTKSTYNQAKANNELKKQAELAAVANQGLIEKFDRQAEQQRQIRDDERKSIEERKKANDELGLILEKQEKAMLSNAQISLRAAQAELKKDKNNIEFKKRVMEAENELAAVRATVTGFRSEQQTNEAALEKEGLELINSRLESENNLSIERKRFDAEQIEDELRKLERLKEIDLEEQEIESKRLQDVINSTNVGTQARIDAEIAYNEFLEESRQKNKTRDKEVADEKVKIEKQKYDEFYDAFWENANKVLEEGKRQEQMLADAKESIQANSLNAMSNLIQAFANQNEKNAERAFNLQKGLAIVETLINTSVAIMKVAKETTDFTPPQALRIGNMVAMGVAGAAQVAAIATQKFNPSGTSGGGNVPTPSGGANTSPTQAPSFNVVGQSQANQVSMALANQPPTQAFVVAGDVTTAQQLQNNTITQATL